MASFYRCPNFQLLGVQLTWRGGPATPEDDPAPSNLPAKRNGLSSIAHDLCERAGIDVVKVAENIRMRWGARMRANERHVAL